MYLFGRGGSGPAGNKGGKALSGIHLDIFKDRTFMGKRVGARSFSRQRRGRRGRVFHCAYLKPARRSGREEGYVRKKRYGQSATGFRKKVICLLLQDLTA